MSNNILAFFCSLIRFYSISVIQKYVYQSRYSALGVFSAILENAIKVAYAGLRVKVLSHNIIMYILWDILAGMYTLQGNVYCAPN